MPTATPTISVHESSQVRGARRERSYDARKPREAEGCSQELAALVEHGYSMTWSTRSRMDSGIVSPSALAVLRLMTSSNFVGCSSGKSPGLAPFRILPVRDPRRLYASARLGPYDMRQPAVAFSRKSEIVASRFAIAGA